MFILHLRKGTLLFSRSLFSRKQSIAKRRKGVCVQKNVAERVKKKKKTSVLNDCKIEDH
jgi:hypothetical protein